MADILSNIPTGSSGSLLLVQKLRASPLFSVSPLITIPGISIVFARNKLYWGKSPRDEHRILKQKFAPLVCAVHCAIAYAFVCGRMRSQSNDFCEII
ncbi:hypothetical protein B9Z19DRAFT_1092804 [Tuber borchii]|uniref:Uncharacterized protein n=1 Tax=Tuber borchii TaxID=42251 RepID=A0A2T6ZG86_TUBBO|nr:hypothetical protein B9Z19DRAFT_1092804 [Tuber borchii]